MANVAGLAFLDALPSELDQAFSIERETLHAAERSLE